MVIMKNSRILAAVLLTAVVAGVPELAMASGIGDVADNFRGQLAAIKTLLIDGGGLVGLILILEALVRTRQYGVWRSNGGEKTESTLLGMPILNQIVVGGALMSLSLVVGIMQATLFADEPVSPPVEQTITIN